MIELGHNPFRELASIRIAEIEEEDRKLRGRLGLIRTLGWPLVVASIICPVIAGSVAFANLTGGKDNVWIVSFSIAGAVSAALHKGLGCDAYQADLRRAIQSLRELLEAYEAIFILPGVEGDRALQAVETRLQKLRDSNATVPPRRERRFSSLEATSTR